jgi:hypothetical protein
MNCSARTSWHGRPSHAFAARAAGAWAGRPCHGIALIAMLLILNEGRAQTTLNVATMPVSFRSVHVLVDPHAYALAAYQIELFADPSRVTLVGIEGGEHLAFNAPPYYDLAALNHNRVILAAFSTSSDLPTTKTRVATLHVRVIGDDPVTWSAKLITAADATGQTLAADVVVSEGAVR